MAGQYAKNNQRCGRILELRSTLPTCTWLICCWKVPTNFLGIVWESDGSCFGKVLMAATKKNSDLVFGSVWWWLELVFVKPKPTRIPKPKQLLDPNPFSFIAFLLLLFFFWFCFSKRKTNLFLSLFFFCKFGSKFQGQGTVGAAAIRFQETRTWIKNWSTLFQEFKNKEWLGLVLKGSRLLYQE